MGIGDWGLGIGDWDQPQALRPPEHAGVPAGEDQENDRTGSAGVRSRHRVQGGDDGKNVPGFPQYQPVLSPDAAAALRR